MSSRKRFSAILSAAGTIGAIAALASQWTIAANAQYGRRGVVIARTQKEIG
ncbi:MAG: hypothetical protein HOP91_08670, partial [Sphingomonas sp.]|nr:hypothetical protein [Sphingomonas sp.]